MQDVPYRDLWKDVSNCLFLHLLIVYLPTSSPMVSHCSYTHTHTHTQPLNRVKKISEQSVAEVAVKMLENETLEVRSASTEKYKRAALDCGKCIEWRREEGEWFLTLTLSFTLLFTLTLTNPSTSSDNAQILFHPPNYLSSQ
jgi:hypothetical protein